MHIYRANSSSAYQVCICAQSLRHHICYEGVHSFTHCCGKAQQVHPILIAPQVHVLPLHRIKDWLTPSAAQGQKSRNHLRGGHNTPSHCQAHGNM